MDHRGYNGACSILGGWAPINAELRDEHASKPKDGLRRLLRENEVVRIAAEGSNAAGTRLDY